MVLINYKTFYYKNGELNKMEGFFKKSKYYLRLLLKQLFQKVPRIWPKVHLLTESHGSNYGGWCIYPLPINRTSIIYSFGIGKDLSFDLSLVKTYGVEIYAFDPTPESIMWVEAQKVPQELHVFDYGVADFDGKAFLNSPNNPQHISHTLLNNVYNLGDRVEVQVYRLETIMKQLGHDHIDLLKMDIEGSEYDVLDDIQESKIQINQLLVEFHHNFPGLGPDSYKIIDR